MNRLLSRHSDLLLALFVIAVAAMLLVPLPTVLLDLLLVVNLAVALLLLLVGLYMPNALALSAFPALLLLTTLFRLSLNVASTRLILSQGDAGEVIQAFGRLLVQGEVVVGLIIFLIITIVNFIVVARGSSRVSEVAARFTLDALPGKQMAIDADLRSGLLTPEEAQQRRETLRTESQLYGAMDGSMKFVQGDAVAGLCIIATNLIGGLYVGLSQGMGFREAVDTYLILTVGDGLVSQIPALLISICAGIVVTRVATGEGRTLGAEVGSQLFTNPAALTVTGGVLVLLGLFSGLPWVPFLIVATALLGGAVLVRQWRQKLFLHSGGAAHDQVLLGGSSQEPGAIRSNGSGELRALLDYSADSGDFAVVLDPSVLFKAYQSHASRHHQWWNECQREFYEQFGLRFPRLQVVPGDHLGSSSYEVRRDGLVVLRGTVPLDAVMVEIHPESTALCGFDLVRPYLHPRTQYECSWVRRNGSLRQLLDAGQIRAFDFLQILALELGEAIRTNPEDGLSVTEIYRQLKQTEKKHPGLVSEAFAKAAASVPRLAEVMHALVRGGLGARDLRQTLESLASYCASQGQALSDDQNLETDQVVQFVRRVRRRELLQPLYGSRQSVIVVTIDEAVAETLTDAEEVPAQGGLAIPADVVQTLRRTLEGVLYGIRTRGAAPVALLCSSELRPKLERFLAVLGVKLPVLGMDELDPRTVLEPAGVWTS